MKSKTILPEDIREEVQDICKGNFYTNLTFKALIVAESEIEEKEKGLDDYAKVARVIHLWLKAFCDESLPYDKMIANAARGAGRQINLYLRMFEEMDKENASLKARAQEIEEKNQAIELLYSDHRALL